MGILGQDRIETSGSLRVPKAGLDKYYEIGIIKLLLTLEESKSEE
jgi:hypothetical protein